jgi:mercuric ion transport protein
VTFGVGAGLASTFEPLRPLFTVLTFAGLAVGFYTVYGRKPRAQAADACCAPGDACAMPRNRTREKVILWTATVLALVFWSFNYWSILLV